MARALSTARDKLHRSLSKPRWRSPATAKQVALLALLALASLALVLAPWGGDKGPGELATGWCAGGWARRRFSVVSEPVTLRYGQVRYSSLSPMAIPASVAEQFRGRTMPVVDAQMEVVKFTAPGREERVPMYEGYLHHYATRIGQAEELMSVYGGYKLKLGKRGVFGNASVPGRNRQLFRGFGAGGGAETKGTSAALPRPYAFLVHSPDAVTPIVHFINLKRDKQSWDGEYSKLTECPCTKQRDVDAARGLISGVPPLIPFGDCNSDLMSDENPSCRLSSYEGGIRCCEDDALLFDTDAPGNQIESLPSSTFHMKVTVDYLECTSGVEWSAAAGSGGMQEVMGESYGESYVHGAYAHNVIDVTGNLTSWGHNEYDIPACAPGVPASECYHQVESTVYVVDINKVEDPSKEVDLVFSVGHLHTGGASIELYHALTNELICRSMPTYGQGHDAGNEKGYLVSMSGCTFSHSDASLPKPPRLKLSDPVRIVARYNSNVARQGVMGLFVLTFADPPGTD